MTNFLAPSILDTYTLGPLRVLIDAQSGEIKAVQDARTGCAASLMYSRGAIATAQTQAHNAWASTADVS